MGRAVGTAWCHPGPCRGFSSIPGLRVLHASNPHPYPRQDKNVPRHYQMSPE